MNEQEIPDDALSIRFVSSVNRKSDKKIFVVFEISRLEIESGDILGTIERLKTAIESTENILFYKNSVILVVSGFENESEHFSKITSVIAYFKILTKYWPYWMWFLSKEPHWNIRLFLSILCKTKVTSLHQHLTQIDFVDNDEMFNVITDMIDRSLPLLNLHISSEDMKSYVNMGFDMMHGSLLKNVQKY